MKYKESHAYEGSSESSQFWKIYAWIPKFLCIKITLEFNSIFPRTFYSTYRDSRERDHLLPPFILALPTLSPDSLWLGSAKKMGKKEKDSHFEWLKRKSRGGHACFVTFPGDRSVAYSSPSTTVQVSPWHTTLCMYCPDVTTENEAASPPAASSLPSSSWKWGRPQNHRKSGITHSGLEQMGFSNYPVTAWNWQTRCTFFLLNGPLWVTQTIRSEFRLGAWGAMRALGSDLGSNLRVASPWPWTAFLTSLSLHFPLL